MSASLAVFVLALVLGQVSGVLILGFWTVMLVGLMVWMVNAALIYVTVSNLREAVWWRSCEE